jgi:hypothetical protein
MSRARLWSRLSAEPPLRVLAKALLARLNVSVATRARWGISPRPAYLVGVLAAAEQARRQEVPEISVIEFGVAGGLGLVALQQEAEAVHRALGVAIKVYGFDMGPDGLPSFIGDYRDHPDAWRPGQFAVAPVRRLLTDRTTLNPTLKIDRWHGVKARRPFPEALFLDALYVAHDLAAISKVQATRRTSLSP